MRVPLLRLLPLLLLVLAAPIRAQQNDLFGDGRLDLSPAAPIVTYCSPDGGLQVFSASGGEVFYVSGIQVEGALAQAALDKTQVQVAAGAVATVLVAYPDGGLALFATNYQFNVPLTSCGGFTPDYTQYLTDLVTFIVEFEESVNESGSTTGITTATATNGQHTVQRGENLFRIGLRYGVDYREIARVNGITNVDRIEVGQVLTIP
jgi:nucleoid-associated protein YgaU